MKGVYMKRKKMSKFKSSKLFVKSGQMMNSKNLPSISRGGIRF